MRTTLTRMIRSTGFAVFLLVLGLFCLVAHFEIYRRTSASAFINQPEFYFRNVFVIRDGKIASYREFQDTATLADAWRE